MNRSTQAPSPLQLSGKKVLALVVTSALGLIGGVAHAAQNWSYTYNPNGQMLTSDGPRDNVNDAADITTYTYDTSGNMATVTNALSHLTQLQDYNGRGQPGKIIDANGVETLLTYHVRGWLETTTVKDPGGNTALDAVMTYGYDNVGQVTSITLPDGVVLTYEYDGAHRLEAIESSQGERIEYTLDAAGNREAEVIKDGGGLIKRTQTRLFDELSRLMDDIGAEGQTTHYDYDVNNNVEKTTDPRTHATDQTFDALNRLKKQIDPDLEEVEYTYDDMDRIKTVTDQRGLVTTYNYDGFGNLTSVVSPDTGTTTYLYDDANNRIKMTDARNVVVDYTYDALNRLATVKYPASPSEDITYTYDDTANGNYGIGRLTGIADESGSIAFHYGHRGNITTKTYTIETTNYSIGYSYDLADKITQITYPSGRLVNYSYDAQGRISAITTQEDAQATAESVISNVTYLPFGPIQSYTYGNGMTHTVSHDQDYRITDIESTGTTTALDLFYDYDPNSNITVLNDEANTSYNQTFDYDKLNRLTDANGNYGNLDYQYDGVGNRTSKTTALAGVTTETYTYDTNSNQLNQIDIDDGATQTQRQFLYDDNGNLIKDTRPDGNVLDLTYNDANRYAALDKSTTPTAAYMYNALGQRTAKVATGGVTISDHYHYDEAGMLLVATTETGIPKREYIYLGMDKVAALVDDAYNNEWDGFHAGSDTDSDGIPDASDNCPNDPNPNQTDADGDTVGNVCDVEQSILISLAAEDGWVRESSETSDVGGARNTTGAGKSALRFGDHNNDRQYKFVVSFDLNDLAGSSPLHSVSSAVLELKRGKITGDVSGFGTASVDLKAGSFGSSALENSDFEAAPTVTNTATLNEGTTATASLNQAGRTAIATTVGASRIQLRIQYSLDDNDDSGNDYSGYYSSNNSNTSRHPRLIIDYTLAD